MIKDKTLKMLAKTLKENELDRIEYKDADFEIKLVKNDVASQNNNVNNANENNDLENINEFIKCPLVGHFYTSRTPVDKPLVKVGDKVKKGQVVCIIQAMKVSNEVKSDGDYIIKKVVPNKGDFVEFGAPLFEVEKI